MVTPSSVRPGPRPAGALSEVCGVLSAAIPFSLTAMAATGAASWRTDEAVVRTVGFALGSAEGLVSATLAQLTMLIPLGNRVLRAEWVSALATGVAGLLMYRLAWRLLGSYRRAPRLAPALSLCAALIATLGPAWRVEGTTAGGAAVGAALALGGLLVILSGPLRSRGWAGLGVLWTLALSESHAAALSLFVAVVSVMVTGAWLPRRRDLALALGFGVVAGLILLCPVLAARLALAGAFDLAEGPLSSSLASGTLAADRLGPLDAWANQVGFVACALGAGGALFGLAWPRTRSAIAGLAALVSLDAVFPSLRHAVLSGDPLAPLHLLATSALSIFVALAVFSLALGLLDLRIRYAETAAVLLVVFTVTLVLVTLDRQSARIVSHRPSPAEVWTDEALAEVPPHSLVLVRTPAVAYRLFAARLVSGARPDVVVVPMPWLGRPGLARRLLDVEPSLSGLIRELSIHGAPSEYALSVLADARPLYVELDPEWDTRLVEHLLPRSLWLTFAPHALGRSDREAALEQRRRSFRRVLREAQRAPSKDPATLAVLGTRARQQATVLAALGDRASLPGVLGDLRTIDPEHPFIAELERRLEADRRGRIDVRGLPQ